MNDLYFKLAHTSIGSSIFQRMNLPQPPELERSPDNSLSVPKGLFLISAAPNSFAVKSALNILNESACNLLYLEQYSDINSKFSVFQDLPNTFRENTKIKTIHSVNDETFDGLIFDATGIDDFEKLTAVYAFFHSSIGKLRRNGKVVILAQQRSQLTDPLASSLQHSLTGFCKSLAKELGIKGITCNIIFLQKGAEKYLNTSLAFFLSTKSAFITGQSINLRSQTIKKLSESTTKPLAGRIALVTGAAQGIGRQTAITLARDGAQVICLDIPQNKQLLDSLKDEIGSHSMLINLLDENAVLDLTQKLASQVGVIDILVHNAGITRDKTLAKMPKDLWDQVLTLNLERVIKMNQSFMEQNIFNEHARIICISSISGIAGNFGQTNYACSKAGVAGYVKAFAESTALKRNSGLTINAIAPGFIETQMTQSMPILTREVGRRLNALSQGGIPLDIAEAVSFFANPGSHCLNGNVLRVCGLSLLGR